MGHPFISCLNGHLKVSGECLLFFLLFQEKIDRDHQKDTLSQRLRSGIQEVSSFNTSQRKTVEKAMATLSSVLAWRVSGTGELGGLPSMGSHRVGHD